MVGRQRSSSSLVIDSDYMDRYYYNYPNYWDNHTRATVLDSFDMIDSVHPGWKKLGNGDNGGICDMVKISHNIVPVDINFGTYDVWFRRGIGKVWPHSWYPTSGSVVSGSGPTGRKSIFELEALGTTAMSRTLPTNPSFGLSRAIGELRKDGIPAVVGMQTIKEKTRYLKNSGNEYLNVEFGWLPLISDIKGLARSVKESAKSIRQYQRSADVKVRRKYEFPVAKTEMNVGANAVYWAPHEQPLGGTGWGNQVIKSESRIRFSGAYIYHIPLGDDFSSKMIRWESEANKLLGLRLTPKLLWDLAPWSWAVGWFSNMGDVINNISHLGLDGLVMQYGYISEMYTETNRMDAWLPCTYVDWSPVSQSGWPHAVYETVTKEYRRLPALWYGFGLSASALSLRQEAVVVALGLSHGLK